MDLYSIVCGDVGNIKLIAGPRPKAGNLFNIMLSHRNVTGVVECSSSTGTGKSRGYFSNARIGNGGDDDDDDTTDRHQCLFNNVVRLLITPRINSFRHHGSRHGRRLYHRWQLVSSSSVLCFCSITATCRPVS